MTTLLVAGGLLVDELSVRPMDMLIQDGRVQAIVPPGHAWSADDVLDASGLHVLPGVVDAHVHFNEPGRTDWEGFVTGSTAAAAGGVTTVCDMPLNCHPPTLDARALALKRGPVADHALVDHAFWGGLVPESLEHAAELQRAGVIGVKAFLCDSGLAEYPYLDDFNLLDAMQTCAGLRLLLALHAEDADETERLGEIARAAGRNAPLDWARSRPASTEVDAVRRALEFARETGPDVRLHFVHISTGAAARLIGEARAAGQDVSLETCPHYLALDESDAERLGSAGKCAPPLRGTHEVEDLWQALLSGTIDWVASDHSPCPPSMKDTDSIWSAWGGVAGVQTLLPVLLTQGVFARGLSLSRLVSLTAGNPSRRLGLYPRKGALEIGSDADLVLVDLARTWTLDKTDLRTRWPVNPFVGQTFRGQVVLTMVRGSVVWHHGAARVEPGFGRLVTA
ncbi:MAG: allantoinase AllB [Chloroflexota bacterium]|nr:allantoinase AllB [Chloroflexota bacterium]